VGILLLNRLTKRWAESIESEHGALFALPCLLELSSVRPAQLRALGFSDQKERTILSLARGCATDEHPLEALANVADDEVLNRLLAFLKESIAGAQSMSCCGDSGVSTFFRGTTWQDKRICTSGSDFVKRRIARKHTNCFLDGTLMRGFCISIFCSPAWTHGASCKTGWVSLSSSGHDVASVTL
jgi:hypothetical protein